MKLKNFLLNIGAFSLTATRVHLADLKLESEPEDLSLADSEDSDLKPSKLEQAASSKPLNHSANGDQPTQEKMIVINKMLGLDLR